MSIPPCMYRVRMCLFFFFFSSRRRHTRCSRDWSSDVCSSDLHDGGGHWIGRGGYSPFGHSGYHPAGIRIGGESRRRSAVQIAAERRFRNYRNDLTLDTRQIKLALKKLRQLSRIGPQDELDLEETIDAT